MSVLVLLEMNAKSGSAADIKNWLRDELHHTRGFDGCNSITFHSNQDDPNNMVFVEDWDSRQQYEKYLAWRVERGDIEKLMGWLGGEPSIRYYENVGV
ncbi:MAG: putative quinol monooxygenase [Candidatus Binatia bacterium]|nr:antibiotic biosynthesis monooxygenase [Chloroflexota bacterium]